MCRKRDIILEHYKKIERSIITNYRKSIWRKFTKAVNDYELIQEDDNIGVCISDDNKSMLLAKLLQEIQKHGQIKFDLEFLFINPGYKEDALEKVKASADLLAIPIKIFNSEILETVDESEKTKSNLCTGIRINNLFSKAKELGCNKIALGHNFDDVIETVLIGILYNCQIKGMMPKHKSQDFVGMELIRPMYLIKEQDIINWANHKGLSFVRDNSSNTSGSLKDSDSRLEQVKELISHLRKVDDSIDSHIFKSMENVNLETIISYKKGGKVHHFLDDYDKIEED